MNTDLEKLYYELMKDPEIKKNLSVLVNTIEATKRFNLNALLRKAYKNKLIRDAFDNDTDGITVHFKLNGKIKKSKNKPDIMQMNLIEKVKKAIEKVYPEKFKTYGDFEANIGGNKYFNVICF